MRPDRDRMVMGSATAPTSPGRIKFSTTYLPARDAACRGHMLSDIADGHTPACLSRSIHYLGHEHAEDAVVEGDELLRLPYERKAFCLNRGQPAVVSRDIRNAGFSCQLQNENLKHQSPAPDIDKVAGRRNPACHRDGQRQPRVAPLRRDWDRQQ